MPDRFATAVCVNPAARRQCRTFFAKCDAPLFLLVLEGWRGFSVISHSVPDIMNCRDDQGRFVCKQYFPEHQHILTQQVPVVRTVSLARDDCKQPLIGDRSTQIVQENGQQC